MMQKGSDEMPEVDVIRAQLFALQDKEYQIFHSRLMPTLPPETVIGVRVPLLRKLARPPCFSAGACPGLRHSVGGNGALFALCG